MFDVRCSAFFGIGRVLSRQIPIIDRPYCAPSVFLDIAAGANPFLPQRRQTLFDITVKSRIAPRTTCVVNAHRLIALEPAVKIFGRRERNLTERHPYIRMLVSGDVNASRIRQDVAAVADRGLGGSILRAGVSDPSYSERIFFRAHSHGRKIAWLTSLPSAELPASGSRGSQHFASKVLGLSQSGSPALLAFRIRPAYAKSTTTTNEDVALGTSSSTARAHRAYGTITADRSDGVGVGVGVGEGSCVICALAVCRR